MDHYNVVNSRCLSKVLTPFVVVRSLAGIRTS